MYLANMRETFLYFDLLFSRLQTAQTNFSVQPNNLASIDKGIYEMQWKQLKGNIFITTTNPIIFYNLFTNRNPAVEVSLTCCIN